MEYVVNENNIRNSLKTYCKEVNKYFKAGNIESSYNKPVIDLIQSFGCTAHDFSGARGGNNGENVDIKLWHNDEDISQTPPFGAIEVKKIGGEDERARKQILIEAKAFGNVILTDNAIWKFYRADLDKMYSGFALLVRNSNGEYEIDESKVDLFIATIKDFILEKPTNIRSPKKLAYYMAEYAKTIKTIIYNILQSGNIKSVSMYNELNALFTKLQQDLLPDLNIKEFSDMYAQTIVYGLFIARYNDNSLKTFSRGEAIENLAKESHLLKQFFQHVATSNNLHPTLDDAINKLCNLFTLTNLQQLLNQYEKKDTIVHFYEDFLTYYDLEQKKNFGAYYTPVQIVRFIIEMVDNVLVNEFKINGGLSNNETISIKVKSDPYTTKRKETKTEKIIDVPKVAILDPACGTGTFGAEIIKFIKDKYFSNGNEIFYKEWLQQENGLMSRLIAFEIMMTSYVIAHLKIRRVISETLGNDILDKELPSNIFLTNTLAEPKSLLEKNAQISFFDFSGAITDEAENADKWKARRPIQVIIGNPPYLAASKNQYDISAYKFEVDGKTKLNERNPKWLNDDYVKFIRFSEQHILKDGKGVLAFITNNGYLDNPTFRGMRASLLRTFDKIYIVNLHGNSMKKETAPDGSKDENVFDIMVGVSIIIGIKTTTKEDFAKVYYSEIFGTREYKFNVLENIDIKFKEIKPDHKMAIFIPQENEDIQNEYNNGISLIDLFNIYSAGVVTGRDSLCVQNKKQDIENVITDFQTKTPEEIKLKYLLGRDTDWTTNGAINDITNNKGYVSKIAYRIFDDRWTYYTGKQNGFYCRPRSEVMKNFSNKNIALCFTRTDKSQRPYSMIFITNKITESCYLTTQTSGIATVVPLYISSDDMLNTTSNLKLEYYNILTQNLQQKPTAEEVFDYCYGILYDIKYRERYNEFLKRDYPRIPIIENQKMFDKYVNAGNKLRKLHLMETNIVKDLSIESSDNNLSIEQVKYIDGKLYINKNTAITGLTDEIFNYYIGGYQVIDKWLKSHKGETLNYENFNHIKKIAGIVEETIRIQDEMIKC